MAGWIKGDRDKRLVGVKHRVDSMTRGKSVVSLVVQPLRGWNDYEGCYTASTESRYVASVAPGLGPIVAACVADAIESTVVPA